MPLGFGPHLLLDRKQERKGGAVILLASENSEEMEGACHGVGHILFSALRMSICTHSKSAAVSYRDVIGIYVLETMGLIRDLSNGNHASD